jgi:biopolymer transport protein TolQ
MMFQSGLFGSLGSLGVISKVVLLLLFLFSVLSWAVIFFKWRVFRAADREDHRFLAAFTKSKDFDELNRHVPRSAGGPSAMIFRQIMDRFSAAQLDAPVGQPGTAATREGGTQGAIDRQYVERTIAHTVQQQIAQLESHLPVLATTGNISPFVGLLGTVMGIIDSFREIGMQGTASIAAVAPGVSEALVATAAGLFAAIPAVIAYNYFLTRIRRTAFRLDIFGVELMNALYNRTKRDAAGSNA